ncbi:hypothetical protein JW887_00360 [Candidatus Dojkabacteria bacterium]|nr:hypothetical protein [Candidatus Dojkabacteria bacterium]
MTENKSKSSKKTQKSDTKKVNAKKNKTIHKSDKTRPVSSEAGSTESPSANQAQSGNSNSEQSKCRRSGGGSIFWGGLFIFIGAIFLLNTLGLLSWSVWSVLWRLWPILLILIGMQVILGRSWIGRLLVGLISLSIFALIAIIAIAALDSRFNNWLGNRLKFWNDHGESIIDTWDNVTTGNKLKDRFTVAKNDYDGVDELNVDISVGEGEFDLGNSGDEYLIVDSSYYKNVGVPKIRTEKNNDSLDIKFWTEKNISSGMIDSPYYDISLGKNELATNLNVDLGAGSGDISFSKLNIKDFNLDIGMGSCSVDLSQTDVNSMDISIGMGSAEMELDEESIPVNTSTVEIGAGSLSMDVPERVGIKVIYNIGLGSLEVGGKTLTGDGSYKTNNFDDAKIQLVLNVDIGTGSIEIERS